MQTFNNIKRTTSSYKSAMAILLFIAVLLSGCHSLMVTKVDYTNIRLDSTLNITPDPKIESVIIPFRTKLMNDMDVVLCISRGALLGGRPESPLTNFCADLVLQEADSICLKRYPDIRVSVSMVNRGGLRVPIPKGEVKVQNMFELMPFENEVVFLKMSGAGMRQFIDHMALRGGEGVSGMRFGIRGGKGVNPEIQGKPLDDTKDYWIVTSDYLANGGDGFEILSTVKDRISTGVKFRDMFINHLRILGQKGISIEAKIDGRVYNAK